MGSTSTSKKPVARAVRSRATTRAAAETIKEETIGQEPIDPKILARQAEMKLSVAHAVKEVTEETIAQSIGRLGVDLSRSLDSVKDQLIAKVRELQIVKEAITSAEEDLTKLYGIEVLKGSIDDLVAEHTEKEIALSAEHAEHQALIAKQQTEALTKNQEQIRELEIARKREADQYEYTKSQQRRTAEDAFTLKMNDLERQNALRQQQLETGWNTRENELRAREDELQMLRSKVAGFDEVLKAATNTAAAQAAGSMKRDLTHEHALITKDKDNALAMANSVVATARAEVAARNQTVADLTTQLQAANNKLAEMANNALNASSGRQALEQVQQFAEKQNTPKK